MKSLSHVQLFVTPWALWLKSEMASQGRGGFPEELIYVGSLSPTVYSAVGTELSTASFIAIKDTEHSPERGV